MPTCDMTVHQLMSTDTTASKFVLDSALPGGTRPLTIECTPACLHGDDVLIHRELQRLGGPFRTAVDEGVVADGSGGGIGVVLVHKASTKPLGA